MPRARKIPDYMINDNYRCQGEVMCVKKTAVGGELVQLVSVQCSQGQGHEFDSATSWE